MTTRRGLVAGELLGVQLAALVLRLAPAIVISAVVGALAGLAVSSTEARRWVSSATIEVGVRYPKEPLENSLVARERLAGHFAAAARRWDPGADIEVAARRDASRALMRYLDVTVYAETSSKAATISERGLTSFMAENARLHGFEHELVEREREYYARWLERLQAAVVAPPPAARQGAPAAPDLGGALFETQKLYNVSAAMVSELRAPPTRIISRPSAPALEPSRRGILVAGGAALGAMAGALVLALRALARVARTA